jgi:hypothetical protein
MMLLQQLSYSPEILKYYHLSAEVVSYFVFILAIFAIINFRKFNTFYLWLFVNICLSAILELLSFYLVKSGLNNTQFINHIYLFQEIVTIGIFYFFAFKDEKIKMIFKYFLILLSIAVIINAFWKEGYMTIPAKFALIESILFSICGLILFRELFINSKIGLYRKAPLFWFNLYILATFISITLFFLVIDNALKISDNLAMTLYIIKNSIGVLFYVFWIIGALKLKKN